LLSSFDIQLVQFTNLKKLYFNVCATSPKCLETKNPTNVGLDEPEAFH